MLYSADSGEYTLSCQFRALPGTTFGEVLVENSSDTPVDIFDTIALIPQITNTEGKTVILSPSFIAFSWASRTPKIVQVPAKGSLAVPVSGYFIENRAPSDLNGAINVVAAAGLKISGYIIRNASSDGKQVGAIDGKFVLNIDRN